MVISSTPDVTTHGGADTVSLLETPVASVCVGQSQEPVQRFLIMGAFMASMKLWVGGSWAENTRISHGGIVKNLLCSKYRERKLYYLA